MKICITSVHDRIALALYVNRQEHCGLLVANDKILDTMYNNIPLIIDINQSDINKLNKMCTFNIINTMEQNQFEFKPFDKVLVRDCNNSPWNIDIYSHYVSDNNYYQCLKCSWNQCIPYNENTAHLVGTDLPYKELTGEPKEYHVWTSGTFNQWFTKTEFEDFIKTAVINNKDIKDFHVLYVKHND